MKMLGKAASVATLALVVLWITGLAVIGMDTGFDTELLATKPKLLAKLSVVTVLTVNSLALHLLAFPRMAVPQADPSRRRCYRSYLVRSARLRGSTPPSSASPSRLPRCWVTWASWACSPG
jgi:hypothetical protein